jgi:hypothetical protein
MQRQFTEFVESPTRDSYLAVREAVLDLTPLPLLATDLAELERLLDGEEFQEVLDRIELLPASKAISPRVHFLAAEAAEALGDVERGELERFLFVLCLKGLLATGNGTQSAPYVVCHAADEHDVLGALSLEVASQTLVESHGYCCDVLTCSDGRQIWFDASATLSFKPVVVKRSRARRQSGRRLTACRRK